jgi:hypothetical protein
VFKIHRSNLITAMAVQDLTFRQLAERARVDIEDLACTHMSSGKAARVALALGLPFGKVVFGAGRAARQVGRSAS